MSFAELSLSPAIVKAITAAGYTEPTPIQSQAIPEVLAGRDVMASAQTGTGKTAAFILPALQRLTVAPRVRSIGPRVLVLTPTRELAAQVSDSAAKYGRYMERLNTVSIVGGMPYPLQNKLLSRPIEILVATPGRLIDHLERGRIDMSRLEMLVLDEADRMLDMGFVDDVETIAAALPRDRQTLLFSATLEGAVGQLSERLLRSPVRIQVAAAKARHENIEQRLHLVDDLGHKNRLLHHLMDGAEVQQAIVFTATKADTETVAADLMALGHPAAALHGDMPQSARNRTLTRLRRGQLRILVATDVAARGIDVAGISHVINYDLPRTPEDYVHRIGRTGRAGANGTAISFAGRRDAFQVKRIESYTGHSIEAHVITGLEPTWQPSRKPAGRGNGRPGYGKSGFGDRQKREGRTAQAGPRGDFRRDEGGARAGGAKKRYFA